jgi:uncharacterized protein (UPF0218 family)
LREANSIPPVIRDKLKKPWGKLLRGSFDKTTNEIREIIKEENSPCVITVGDVVSKNLVEGGIHPKLLVVDNKVMRTNVKSLSLPEGEEVHVKNPPGTITREAIKAIREAFKTDRIVKIIVDGEEDLLTLVAVLYAPENSIVVYGQPGEGAVVVKVTKDKKDEAADILKAMNAAKG